VLTARGLKVIKTMLIKTLDINVSFRVFQAHGAAMAKALSPIVVRRVAGTMRSVYCVLPLN